MTVERRRPSTQRIAPGNFVHRSCQTARFLPRPIKPKRRNPEVMAQ